MLAVRVSEASCGSVIERLASTARGVRLPIRLDPRSSAVAEATPREHEQHNDQQQAASWSWPVGTATPAHELTTNHATRFGGPFIARLGARSSAVMSPRRFEATNHRDLGLFFALQGEIARLRPRRVLSGPVVHTRGHDDLPARRGGLEACCCVYDVTDRCEVLHLARANVAHVGSAEVETDADLHPRLSIEVARSRQRASASAAMWCVGSPGKTRGR